jgi:hypothetical protein
MREVKEKQKSGQILRGELYFDFCYVQIKMKKKEEKSADLRTEDTFDATNAHKIQSLREMINNAEKTIQSAKAMLLNLEGKKKTGRRRKVEEETDGTVVEGTFDGQIMIGTDGKQYPVPANYASKSKLVEGDMLKLTITLDGSFIYKQIGPAARKHALGIVSQDESENYNVMVDGRPYKVLLASITYFKAEPGDEVAVVMPRDIESSWIAIENVLQKGDHQMAPSKRYAIDDEIEALKDDIRGKSKEKSVIDEWTADIEEIEKEIEKEKVGKE